MSLSPAVAWESPQSSAALLTRKLIKLSRSLDASRRVAVEGRQGWQGRLALALPLWSPRVKWKEVGRLLMETGLGKCDASSTTPARRGVRRVLGTRQDRSNCKLLLTACLMRHASRSVRQEPSMSWAQVEKNDGGHRGVAVARASSASRLPRARDLSWRAFCSLCCCFSSLADENGGDERMPASRQVRTQRRSASNSTGIESIA